MNYPQIKPTLNLDFSNTKTLDPRINFRRGTPGAYYDGKTYAKAEENLISYSEDFSNAYWNKVRIDAPTPGQSSPDGQSTAYLLTQTNDDSSGVVYVNGLTGNIGEEYTLSVYAKAGTASFLGIAEEFSRSGVNTKAFTYFDLSSDEVSLSHENHVADIQSIGDQWYRCSITFTVVTASVLGPLFYISDVVGTTDASSTVPSGSSIYVWGAQLEQRDSVTAYTPTNGNPITKYQPQLMFASPDQPRFDHDVLTGESKGLLIEEERANLVQDSEFIEDISSNGTWWNQTATVSSVEKNQTISPSGEVDATKIIYNTNQTSGGLVMKYHTNTSVGDIFTGSVYLKAGTLDKVYFYFNARDNDENSVASPAIIANLSSGVIESTQDSGGMTISDSSIDDVGNGWYRIAMTSTVITGVDIISLGIYMSGGPTNSNAVYDHFFVWGAQLEAGSFATSYIKTSGASATRSADNASITGENFSSWYRQDEGSLYSEVNTLADSSASRISMSDGTSSNRIFISNGIYPLYVNKNGNIQVREESSAIINAYSKRAAGLKKDDFAISIDGGEPLIDTAGELPLVDRLAFSTSHTSDNHVNGHIKKLAYYPQRLTNEQLQNLTK